MIPESYQPTPRQRQHRALVRHRQYLQGRITSVRSKIRHIFSNSNADRKDLFSANCGLAYLKEVRLSDVDRSVIKQLWAEWQDHLAQRLAVSKKLKAFVAKAPQREAEDREILKTAPGVGPVTAEVVLSELGDISRFRNAKTVCAYAGLVPVVRQSGERKSKDMKITKEGSGLLRWALVEAAWRLVGKSPKWAALFARLMHRSGKGHRGGGQEAALRALRHAQDVDSVQDRNFPSLQEFLEEARTIWRHWLSRRRHDGEIPWSDFLRLEQRYGLPRPRVVHSLLRSAAKS